MTTFNYTEIPNKNSMIKLYNSLSGKKEKLKTMEPGRVRMYNCGPTVYDRPHMGNLRSFVFADIFRRVFEYNGYEVKQVMSITDVGHLTDDGDGGEDKVERAATQKNKKASEITSYFTEKFFKDIRSLNIKTENTIFSKASENIKEQMELIKKLETKGYTYRTSDGIYFNTSQVSNCDLFRVVGKNPVTETRVEINSEKHCPTDFALWKFTKPYEKRQQEWESPWGVGFPGWHSECSAMAIKYLGEQLDIHTGGADHKLSHHPNEIIQSEYATGRSPFSRYWLHNEFLSLNDARMSKSEGSPLTLKEIKEKGFSPESFRFWLLGTHYRSPASFTWQGLRGAHNAYEKISEEIRHSYPETDPDTPPDKNYIEEFKEIINDDFDTPNSLALLWKIIKDKNIDGPTKVATAFNFDTVLGLNFFTQVQKESEIQNEKEKPPKKDRNVESDKNRRGFNFLRNRIKK